MNATFGFAPPLRNHQQWRFWWLDSSCSSCKICIVLRCRYLLGNTHPCIIHCWGGTISWITHNSYRPSRFEISWHQAWKIWRGIALAMHLRPHINSNKLKWKYLIFYWVKVGNFEMTWLIRVNLKIGATWLMTWHESDLTIFVSKSA